MEMLKSIKSLVVVSTLVLSMALLFAACEKKTEYVPTPAALTPAVEILTPTAVVPAGE